MTKEKHYNECILQLVGNAWRKKDDKYEYMFELFPYEGDNKEKDLYGLKINDTTSDNKAYTFYKVVYENGSWFLTFLKNTYKVLHIYNPIENQIMKLEDSDGKIISYSR